MPTGRYSRIVPLLVSSVACAYCAAQLAAAPPKGDGEESRTVTRLRAACLAEQLAHARYEAFATRAAEEGYEPVASLFRAAAVAENIHYENHARVLTSLGVTPTCGDLPSVTVGTTEENLRTAIAGENEETEQFYADCIGAARCDGNCAAMRSFHFARKAERSHARLFQDAADHLGILHVSTPAVYRVCPVCGTICKDDEFTFQRCPTCFRPAENYRTQR